MDGIPIESRLFKTRIRLERQDQTIPRSITSSDGGMEVVPTSQRRQDLVMMLDRSLGPECYGERSMAGLGVTDEEPFTLPGNVDVSLSRSRNDSNSTMPFVGKEPSALGQ